MGFLVNFRIKNSQETVEVFTERPEILFGCTFIANKKLAGKLAVNPVNGEEVPVLSAIFADGRAVAGVPAHDQQALEFARKNNIPIRVVLEPITGEPQINPEKRRSIVALVKNNGKTLSINWGPTMGGNLLVGGGLKENEDPVECAHREVTEETGYKDLKFVEKSEKIHHSYFAHSKNVARLIEATGIYFELAGDGKKEAELEEDEKGKFTVEWLSEADADAKIKDALHRYVYDKFAKGLAYAGEGIMVNSGKYDGMESAKARELILADLTKIGVLK